MARRTAGQPPTLVLIAGGGTAGHLIPGLEVAEVLVERGHDRSSIHFVGSERGPEAKMVPEAGFEVTLLTGRGIQRRLARENGAALAGLAKAGVAAQRIVRERRPGSVLSLGGYAAAACAAAAVTQRVPLILAEQNALAGLTNRLVSPFAVAAAVPFEATDLRRSIVTGNPVRRELLAVNPQNDRARARDALGLPQDRFVLASFAGSLGSRRINQALLGAVAQWADRDDLAVRHVVGRRDFHDVVAARPDLSESGVLYQQVEYEDQMALLLAAADLVLTRSGGSTVAELAAVGVGSLLVPLPIAPRDHQRANAAELVAAGAAVLIDDEALDADRIVAEVDPFIADRSRTRAMASAARSLRREDAAERIADEVERYG